MTQLFLIILTAVITSSLTLFAAWYVYEHHLKDRLMEQIDTKSEEVGRVLKERVREGVRDGIQEGLSGLPTDLVGKATKTVTKTGMGVLEDSINLVFGTPKSRSDK